MTSKDDVPMGDPANLPALNAEAGRTDGKDHFEALLEYIKRTRGFDFTAYKRMSLERRFRKRMQVAEADTFEAYMDYLEVHPNEFTHLFNTVLINVTGFFRDPAAWEYINTVVVPAIIAHKGPDEMLRVWCAGAASGEEAYTCAILAEVLGEDVSRARVKIYATDVDEDALTHARQATYGEHEVAGIGPHLLARYFERLDSSYIFRRDLRRTVIFGRHDLLQDAPIAHVDLLVCRNTLMDFYTEAQSRILNRFHFALEEGGFLLLGRAEMLFTHATLFSPVDLKRRIFAKARQHNGREWVEPEPGNDDNGGALARSLRLRGAVMDSSPTALLAVDANGGLALANQRGRALFGITDRDVGRPINELEFTRRLAGLRLAIEQAAAVRRPIFLTDIQWLMGAGDIRYLEVQVTPLLDAGRVPLGTAISIVDNSSARKLKAELEHSRQELERAYEELQSTNEELETTNEELQSAVEELETTNAELQSTNEELETLNEELQSANEEVQTVNDDLRQGALGTHELTVLMRSVLVGLPFALVVLDSEWRIRIWNRCAEDFSGLRSDDVLGQHFMSLDIGLPLEQFRQPLRCCLSGECESQRFRIVAINRRGKQNNYNVVCNQLRHESDAIGGVIILMETGVGAFDADKTPRERS